MTRESVSNSLIFAFICALAILYVVLVCMMFVKKSFTRANELGIPKEKLMSIVKSTAVFSVLPSLPILVVFLAMVPGLGKFLPWFRLSVIGDIFYETACANETAKAMGYTTYTDPTITADAFGSFVWTMSIAVLFLLLFNVIFLKKYVTSINNVSSKKSNIPAAVIISAMTIGVLGAFSGSQLVQAIFKPEIAFAFAASLITAILLEKYLHKKPSEFLKNFAFSLSMIVGMAAAIAAKMVI